MVLFVFVVSQPAKAQEIPDSTKQEVPIIDIPEILPVFPGGDEARQKFLMDNTLYPKEAEEKGIEGRVIVSFVVEIDGSISNVKVIHGVHPLLDEEAIRITKQMPNWEPGKQRGEPIRCRFNMPFKFVLKKDDPPAPIPQETKGKQKGR